MKTDLHPAYHAEAAVHCSGCDRTFTVGSTAEKIQVELCSNCHPFYTGKQKLVDTAGRVDRFRARAAKAAEKSASPAAVADATEAAEEEGAAPSDPSPEDRLAEMKKSLETQSDK